VSKAGKKIIEGLENAAQYAAVQRAVQDWIRDDAPLAAKMNLMPTHVAKLADRICGSRTTIKS
jgi:hypothetical protein